MFIKTLWSVAICLAGSTAVCAQQQQPQDPTFITTDRPAVADASTVVPFGTLVVENGLTFTTARSGGPTVFDATETLFRLGITPKTEIRFTPPEYFAASRGSGADGWSDLSVGLKHQIGPVKNFDISLVLSVSLPTGSPSTSSHGYDPAVQVPWSRSLSPNWTLAGMASVYWPTQLGGRRNVTGENTIFMDRQFTKRWDAFTEYVFDAPERGGVRHLLHFGTAFKLTPSQQLDFHLGKGLNSAATGRFIGLGYSFRLGLWRQY